MVYLNNKIKIIDFGSGKFIENLNEIENNKIKLLANKNKIIDIQYTTQLYRGPENNIYCLGENSNEFNELNAEVKIFK
jgi:hypothetical protein